MQQRIYEEQNLQIKKMELEIKKRYVMSKKHVYGIENEYQIIQ